MGYRVKLFVGAAIGAMLLPSLAAAQSAGVASPDTVDQSAVNESAGDSIVVTARRRAERLQDVPVAAATISGDRLVDANVTTLTNLRELAPGVAFDRAQSGSGASLSIRGVSSSPQDPGIEQSVLINLDNMPMSRGRILNDGLFDIEAVELLKGPQALFFGKNSPAGVISIRSANPTSELQVTARGTYEFSNDEAKFESSISGPLGGNFGGRLAVFVSDSKGFVRNINPGVADPFHTATTGGTFIPAAPARLGAETRYAGRATLQYKDDRFTANLKVLYSKYTGDGFQSLVEAMSCAGGRTRPISSGFQDPNGDCMLNNRTSKGHISPTIVAAWPEARFAQNGPKSEAESFLPILNMNFALSPTITLSSTTAYYWYKVRSAGQAGDNAYTFFWFYNAEKYHDFSQELRIDTDFGGPVDFSGGLFFSDSKRDFSPGATLSPLPADPVTGKYNNYDSLYKNKTRSYSVFGQIRVKPIESVEIAVGGRYTNDRKDFDAQNTFVHANVAASFRPQGNSLVLVRKEDNFSPEATVSWKISPEAMIYAAYKTGYLAGGFSSPGQVGAAASQATLMFGAEKAKGGEVGFKFESGDRRFRGSLTGYYYEYTGLQLTALDAVTATYKTQNAASANVKGIEFEGFYRLNSDLSLRAALAYNDAKFGSFTGAQCYAGQTAAQGCVGGVQDQSGKPLYRAPEWAGSAGIRYEKEFSNIKITAGVDASYASDYYALLTLNPGSYQDGFWLLNANVSLSPVGSPWRLSLIGKNLTNKIYGTLANDAPGGAGDVLSMKGDPRTVAVQVELKF